MENQTLTPDQDNEKTLWSGQPSQFANIFKYIILILIFILFFYFVPVGFYKSTYVGVTGLIYFFITFIILFSIFIYYYLTLFSIRYKLTSDRLFIHTGILTRKREQIELYRIKDYTLIAPLLLRIFNLSNIQLISSDRTTPHPELFALKEGEKICDLIRSNVEKQRIAKGTKEVDFDMEK
jgi:uncharacterized membrane protein YdbT with pleckstrin-like domain